MVSRQLLLVYVVCSLGQITRSVGEYTTHHVQQYIDTSAQAPAVTCGFPAEIYEIYEIYDIDVVTSDLLDILHQIYCCTTAVGCLRRADSLGSAFGLA